MRRLVQVAHLSSGRQSHEPHFTPAALHVVIAGCIVITDVSQVFEIRKCVRQCRTCRASTEFLEVLLVS